jgi:hypothetical protein
VASPEKRQAAPDITPLMGAVSPRVKVNGPDGVKEDGGRRPRHRLK